MRAYELLLHCYPASFRYEYGGQTVHLTTSVGGAAATGLEPVNAGDLLSWADQQLYEAKARGRNLCLV